MIRECSWRYVDWAGRCQWWLVALNILTVLHESFPFRVFSRCGLLFMRVAEVSSTRPPSEQWRPKFNPVLTKYCDNYAKPSFNIPPKEWVCVFKTATTIYWMCLSIHSFRMFTLWIHKYFFLLCFRKQCFIQNSTINYK